MSATQQRGIGGSDVAAILGLSPYKTPLDVYNRIINGDERAGSTRMKLGQIAEPHILYDFFRRGKRAFNGFGDTKAAAEYMKVLDEIGVQRNIELQRKDFPYMRGELDALVPKAYGIECKLVGFRQADRWGEDGSDDIPDEYLCQVAWYAMLADVPVMYIAAWFDGGGDYREFKYDRNLELEGKLVSAARDFWENHVIPQKPPLEGASFEALKAVFPRSNGEIRIATPAEAEAIALYAEAREKREAAEQVENEHKQLLMGMIGDAEGVAGPLGKVTWKSSKPGKKTDWEAVAKALNAPADVVSAHTIETPGNRRFLFTKPKER